MYKNIKICLVAVAILWGAGVKIANAATNLLINPSFETSSPLTWVITGSVSRSVNTTRALDGDAYLGMNAGNVTPNATITQTINNTVIGETYLLSFNVAKYATGSGNSVVSASVYDGTDTTGTLLLQGSVSTSDGASGPLIWKASEGLYFVAVSTSTTLQFTDVSSNNGNAFDTYLDMVSITAVPEPSRVILTVAALGVFLGRRRRYQAEVG